MLINQEVIYEQQDVSFTNMTEFVEPIEEIKIKIKDKQDKEIAIMIKEINKALIKQKQEQQEENDRIKYINIYDVREISNISKKEIEKLLENTTYNNDEVINTLYNAEKRKMPINILFIIAITKLESGNGNSKLSNTHNNLGGYISRGSFKSYNSHSDSVQDIINLLSDYYINSNSKHFVGYDIFSIGNKYCVGGNWANKINTIINELKGVN